MASPAREQLNIRVTPAFRKRLDELAARQRSTPAATVKALVMGASQSEDETTVATEDEILRLLTLAARGGSVSAMKELRNYHRERTPETEEEQPLASVDDLAARRRA